jgi:hypothetical protein
MYLRNTLRRQNLIRIKLHRPVQNIGQERPGPVNLSQAGMTSKPDNDQKTDQSRKRDDPDIGKRSHLALQAFSYPRPSAQSVVNRTKRD